MPNEKRVTNIQNPSQTGLRTQGDGHFRTHGALLRSRDEVVCGGADGGDDLRLVCGQRYGHDKNMVFPARVKSMV